MSSPERQQPGNPLQQAQAAAQNLGRDFGRAWHAAAQHVQQGFDGFGRALSHVAQLPGAALQQHGGGLHIQPLLPGVAVRLSGRC